MKKFNIDGIDYDAAPEVVNFISKIQAQAADSKAEVETLKKNADGEKAEITKAMDGLKGQLAAAEADKKVAQDALAKLEAEIPARAEAIAKDKADIMLVASAVLPAADVVRVSALDSAGVKAEIIKAKYPSIKLDSQSADFVNGLFESVKASVKDSGSLALHENRATSQDSSLIPAAQVVNADSAREAMEKRLTGAYLKPGTF